MPCSWTLCRQIAGGIDTRTTGPRGWSLAKQILLHPPDYTRIPTVLLAVKRCANKSCPSRRWNWPTTKWTRMVRWVATTMIWNENKINSRSHCLPLLTLIYCCCPRAVFWWQTQPHTKRILHFCARSGRPKEGREREEWQREENTYKCHSGQSKSINNHPPTWYGWAERMNQNWQEISFENGVGAAFVLWSRKGYSDVLLSNRFKLN